MPACRIGDMITTTITSWRARVRAVALALVIIAVATGLRAAAIPPAQAPAAAAVERPALIPWPASVTMAPGESFPITRDTVIEITPKQPQLRRSADLVADLVWPALEARLAIRDAGPTQLPGTIRLEVEPTGTRPDEGYDLTVTRDGIRIARQDPRGRLLRRPDAAPAAAVVHRAAGRAPVRRARCRPPASPTRRASAGAARCSTSPATSSARPR